MKNVGFPQTICPYCGEKAELVRSKEVYGEGYPDYGWMYLCRPCDAYVGCHPGRAKPLGALANAETRDWRKRAHAAFDPLWKRKMVKDRCSKTHARKAGYKWLAKNLGISTDDCHIGMFNVETCKKVILLCAPYHKARMAER